MVHPSILVSTQLDPAIGVRKWLAGFLGEVCSRRPLPAILSMAAGCLGSLAYDGAPGVVKLALLSCVHLVRGALGSLAQQVGIGAETATSVQQVWGASVSLSLSAP
jgi:hypothetical protein